MRFPSLSIFPFGRRKKSDASPIEYASFSARTFALVFDMLILIVLLSPVLQIISETFIPSYYLNGGNIKAQQIFLNLSEGAITAADAKDQLKSIGYMDRMLLDIINQFILCGFPIIFSWVKFNTTPGLYIFRCYVADASTGMEPSLKQYINRYIVGVFSVVPMMIGMLPMFFNKRKMALQDFTASTVVLRRKYKFEYRKAEAEKERQELEATEPLNDDEALEVSENSEQPKSD